MLLVDVEATAVALLLGLVFLLSQVEICRGMTLPQGRQTAQHPLVDQWRLLVRRLLAASLLIGEDYRVALLGELAEQQLDLLELARE